MTKEVAGPNNFAMVPRRAYLDKRLTRGDHCVLGAICGSVRKGTTKAWIGQEKISQHTELSRRQVCRAIDRLKGWGYLTKVSRKSKKSGRQQANVYDIHYLEPDQAASEASSMASSTCDSDDLPGTRLFQPAKVAACNGDSTGHPWPVVSGFQPARSDQFNRPGVAGRNNRVTLDGTRPCDIFGPFEAVVRVPLDGTDSYLIDNHTLEALSETPPPLGAPPPNARNRQSPNNGRDNGESEEAERAECLQGVLRPNHQHYLFHGIEGGKATIAERKGAERRIWRDLERLSPGEREQRTRELMDDPELYEAEIKRRLKPRRAAG